MTLAALVASVAALVAAFVALPGIYSLAWERNRWVQRAFWTLMAVAVTATVLVCILAVL